MRSPCPLEALDQDLEAPLEPLDSLREGDQLRLFRCLFLAAGELLDPLQGSGVGIGEGARS